MSRAREEEEEEEEAEFIATRVINVNGNVTLFLIRVELYIEKVLYPFFRSSVVMIHRIISFFPFPRVSNFESYLFRNLYIKRFKILVDRCWFE